MSELWLGLFDLLVLAWLVSAYLRLRRLLAGVAASVSDQTEPDEDGSEPDSWEPTRVTGVVRSGRLAAMFAVIEIDADTLYLRSRPKWLGLAVAVPRGDVAQTRVATGKSGLPTFFRFEPVSGHAIGLGGLRILLRRDPVGFRRQLVRLGWLGDEPGRAVAPRPRRHPRLGGVEPRTWRVVWPNSPPSR